MASKKKLKSATKKIKNLPSARKRSKLAEKKESGEFLKPGDVLSAQEQHEQLHATMAPWQKAICDDATAAMNEINEFFWQGDHGAKLPANETVDMIAAVCDRSGLSREEAVAKIKATPKGNYFLDDLRPSKAYFVSAAGKIQEVAAYCYALEKATIKAMQASSDSEARLEKVKKEKMDLTYQKVAAEVQLDALQKSKPVERFWPLIKRAFRAIWRIRQN